MTTQALEPDVTGTLYPDGSAVLTHHGRQVNVQPTGSLDQARYQVVEAVSQLAREAGVSGLHVRLSDPEVSHPTDLRVSVSADTAPSVEVLSAPTQTLGDAAQQPAPERPAAGQEPPSDPFARSFLQQPGRRADRRPARTGWRGAINRLGLRLPPNEEEAALRRAVHTVSQHWPGVRRVAIANGKGSASKTPTSIMLSAVYGRHGSGGVVLIDNNPNRNTLSWRTEQGAHDATVRDLLPALDTLLRPEASHADLAGYLHHQSEDGFDVLRSTPRKLTRPFTADELEGVVQLLSRYYRIQVFDSGNHETDEVWQRMITLSTSLVVPTLARTEWAESARLMLQELRDRDQHGATLVANAVVIVSNADQHKSPADVQAIADGFAPLVRGVAVIPFDRGMVEGHLRWDGIRPSTRDAWVHAAALVADGF